MIEMYEVINYEVVSKMLNLLYSQKPHSISPLFYPNSASNPSKITPFSPSFHPISPQISLHFALITPQYSLNFTHSLHQSHPLHRSTGTFLYIPLRDD